MKVIGLAKMEQYFSNFHEKKPVIFIVLAFIVSLIPSLLMQPFFQAPDLTNGNLSALGDLFPYFVIFFVPILETLACQALPALIIDIFDVPTRIRIAAITVPFAAGHIIPSLVFPSLINGISGGLILGICYLVCQRKSCTYAILITILVHGAHNAMALAIGD